jgi:outer membrane protein
MKKPTLRLGVMAVVAAASFAAPLLAQAQSGPWLVRLRAVNLDSANKSDTSPALGLSVNNKVIPEVDISYFVTPEIATELVLTYPQKHTVYSDGTEIGSLKHLPPTLTLQYHFTQFGALKPYLGAGVNYTHFSSVRLPAGVTIKNNSVGLALQAGLDYEIGKNTYLNVDVKKVQIGTDVKLAGAKIGTFKVDPWLLGVGVGWRF